MKKKTTPLKKKAAGRPRKIESFDLKTANAYLENRARHHLEDGFLLGKLAASLMVAKAGDRIDRITMEVIPASFFQKPGGRAPTVEQLEALARAMDAAGRTDDAAELRKRAAAARKAKPKAKAKAKGAR